MKMTFVDTSGFMELIDKQSSNFNRISATFQKAVSEGNLLITTDYVIDELFTLMRCREKLPTSDVLKFLDNVKVSDIQLVGITKELFQEALVIMGKYSDQYFSFTDCVSFAVMKEMGIKDFIGMDNHFSTAGFNNLLKV